MAINFTDFIPPHFYELAKNFMKDKYGLYWLEGGRGSTKSSVATALIIIGLMRDPQSHALFARRYKVDLHSTVYSQVKKTIKILGVDHLFKISQTDFGAPPMTYLPTGQKIIFAGLDDPDGLRSLTPDFGYMKYSMFEEIQQMENMEKLRSATQSIRRGGDVKFVTFYCYNPPRSKSNWTYKERLEKQKDSNAYVHHSNWEMLPDELARKWLGSDWIHDALHIKEHQPDVYEHEYLGIPIGYGTNVYKNLELRTIDQKELNTFDNVVGGLDWGFADDPFAYTRSHYDSRRRILYIFDEIVQRGLLNRESASKVGAKLYRNPRELIVADPSEAKSIAEYQGLGLNIQGAKRGAGSIESGIKFLQELESIVIDPERCPVSALEFSTAEFAVDRYGEVLPRVDKDNHCMDGIRYRMEVEQRAKSGWR